MSLFTIKFMRENKILKQLNEKNAIGKDNAKTLEELAIVNNLYTKIAIQNLIKNKKVYVKDNNKYFINK